MRNLPSGGNCHDLSLIFSCNPKMIMSGFTKVEMSSIELSCSLCLQRRQGGFGGYSHHEEQGSQAAAYYRAGDREAPDTAASGGVSGDQRAADPQAQEATG